MKAYRPFKTCSIPECGGNVQARGLCESHYRRLRLRGTTEPAVRAVERTICQSADCGEFVRAKGLCSSHYQKIQRQRRLPVPTSEFELKKCRCGKTIERSKWGDGQLASPSQYKRRKRCDACRQLADRRSALESRVAIPRSEEEIRKIVGREVPRQTRAVLLRTPQRKIREVVRRQQRSHCLGSRPREQKRISSHAETRRLSRASDG